MRDGLGSREEVRRAVEASLGEVRIADMHTHVYDPAFGPLLLWGIDELLDYHYVVAEFLRHWAMDYEAFWAMPQRRRTELIWRTMFLDRSPVSEACRGVLTCLQRLGCPPSERLEEVREFFGQFTVRQFVDRVFSLARVRYVVMTNDPFDPAERDLWMRGLDRDPRFKAALRIDRLLTDWPAAVRTLGELGYTVGEQPDERTLSEVRRFLAEWIERMDAVYLAASLPPTFAYPEDSVRGRVLEQTLLPVARERGLAVGLMIGVKRGVNPALRLAGDGVGKASIDAIERLCARHPENRFLLTLLSRENQHEACVAARKFRNLMPFGCWWFTNVPSLIEEITRERLELLGTSFIPQHSDARVLDQLLYKWDHFRALFARVLTDAYDDLRRTGWPVTAETIARDLADMLAGNFERFAAPAA